jgi:hypothetical protein
MSFGLIFAGDGGNERRILENHQSDMQIKLYQARNPNSFIPLNEYVFSFYRSKTRALLMKCLSPFRN